MQMPPCIPLQVLANPHDARGLQITHVNKHRGTKVHSVLGWFVSSVTKLLRNVLMAIMKTFFHGSVVTLSNGFRCSVLKEDFFFFLKTTTDESMPFFQARYKHKNVSVGTRRYRYGSLCHDEYEIDLILINQGCHRTQLAVSAVYVFPVLNAAMKTTHACSWSQATRRLNNVYILISVLYVVIRMCEIEKGISASVCARWCVCMRACLVEILSPGCECILISDRICVLLVYLCVLASLPGERVCVSSCVPEWEWQKQRSVSSFRGMARHRRSRWLMCREPKGRRFVVVLSNTGTGKVNTVA